MATKSKMGKKLSAFNQKLRKNKDPTVASAGAEEEDGDGLHEGPSNAMLLSVSEVKSSSDTYTRYSHQQGILDGRILGCRKAPRECI